MCVHGQERPIVYTGQNYWAKTPHEVTPACVDKHCYSCGVDEDVPRSYYLVCGECGHVYRTPEELVAADQAWRDAAGLPAMRCVADDVASCPLCGHDF